MLPSYKINDKPQTGTKTSENGWIVKFNNHQICEVPNNKTCILIIVVVALITIVTIAAVVIPIYIDRWDLQTYNACPGGYAKFNGDVTDPLIGITWSSPDPPAGMDSRDYCKILCEAYLSFNSTPCNSFVYSARERQCKLSKETNPTKPKFRDFQFCGRKSDSTSLRNKGSTSNNSIDLIIKCAIGALVLRRAI